MHQTYAAAMSAWVILAIMNTANAAPMPDHTATGTFDITLTPDPAATGPIQHLTFTKTFHGALQASSAGHMLGVHTPVKGSAAYVVLEQITGTLDGHAGSFTLQHSGTMAAGTATATITVVPDSGTGALKNLTGAMTITIDHGQHHYSLAYRL
jgi:hypothetical protein